MLGNGVFMRACVAFETHSHIPNTLVTQLQASEGCSEGSRHSI